MGFEPTRAEHIGLAVQRLNHSATSSVLIICYGLTNVFPSNMTLENILLYNSPTIGKRYCFPCRESNPGLLGESQVS